MVKGSVAEKSDVTGGWCIIMAGRGWLGWSGNGWSEVPGLGMCCAGLRATLYLIGWLVYSGTCWMAEGICLPGDVEAFGLGVELWFHLWFHGVAFILELDVWFLIGLGWG